MLVYAGMTYDLRKSWMVRDSGVIKCIRIGILNKIKRLQEH